MGKFVSAVIGSLREAWLFMLEPPWRHTGPEGKKDSHWLGWLQGWAWVVAGMALGATISPQLILGWGLSGLPYQDELVIGIAVLTGLVVQFVGIFLVELGDEISMFMDDFFTDIDLLFYVVASVVPLAVVVYLLYNYLSLVTSGQRSVTIAFVGALLIKTFAIPLIKAIVTGTAFRFLMRWLRGKDSKTA